MLPSIMIGIMVKNGEEYLPGLFEQIKNLNYDKDKLRIVFEYGKSSDKTLELLKDFVKNSGIKTEIYQEQFSDGIRKYGVFCNASIYNDWQQLLEEDFFLLLDTDIVYIPPDLLKNLISYNEDIVAPFIWSEKFRHFYDNYVFRIGNRRFDPIFPPGTGLDEPFEVDSVGTCYLARREVFKNTPITDPQPYFIFAMNAKRKGYKILADPTNYVLHADIELKGKFHAPPPQELGFVPEPTTITSLDKVVSLNGNINPPLMIDWNKNPLIRKYQMIAYCSGMKNYSTNPDWKKKGKNWCYNYAQFQIFWKTGISELRNAMFEDNFYPRYIEIEVTTRCNLRCKMCEHTYWKEPAIDMTLEQFKSIIDQFPDLCWIGLTGIGESFLNKDFIEMLKYVKKKNVFIELYDTFFFLDEKMITDLVDIGVDRIIASVDAASKETYEKLRVNSNYEKVWNNIVFLDKYKKEKKTGHYPELCFHFIVSKDNYNECLDYLQKLKDLKLDVEFVQFGRMLHSFPETKEMFIEVPEEIQQKIRKKADELSIKLSWNADIMPNKPPVFFCTEIFMPFIFVNGDVITCCAMNEANKREWQHQVSLGNIFKTPFKEIWNNEKYLNVRNSLYNKAFPNECQDCPVYGK